MSRWAIRWRAKRAGGQKPAVVLVSLLLILSAAGLGTGFPQRVSFTRNSSGITAACMAAAEYAKQNRQKELAVIYTDHSAASYEGYRELAGQVSLEEKPVIILDCVCADEHLVLSCCPESAPGAEKLLRKGKRCGLSITENRTDRESADLFRLFPTCIYLSGGSIKNRELVIENTRNGQDREISFSAMQKLVRLLSPEK